MRANILLIFFYVDLFQRTVSSQAELMESMERFGLSAKDLMSQAAKRQQELTDPTMRDDLVRTN